MLLVATLVAAAGAAVITPAHAEPAQLSDVAYMQAARCAGLAEGAKRDTAYVKALLNKEEGNRMNWIYDKANELRSDAERDAHGASGLRAERIANELNACQVYLGDGQTASVTPTSAH